MPELNFKGKEFVYNHHLTVPFRSLEPQADKGIGEPSLDGNAMIRWWHRNGTVYGSYALRGWKRGRVYPDFLFAAIRDGDKQRLVALESKGEQLDNLDTAYKRTLLDKLTEAYGKHVSGTADELELQGDAPDYEAAVVLFGEMDAHLPGLIKSVGKPE